MKIKQSNKNKAGKIFSTTSGSTLREKTPNQALQPTQKPLRAFWSPELPRCLQKGLKMKRIAIIAIFLMVAVAVKAEDTSLSQVAERLSKIAEQMKPVALVVQNGRNVTLSNNTRTFMVHSSDKLGRRSDKAHKETGPRYDGLMVHVTVGDGRYAGAAELPQDLRGPYWTTFVNAYPIAKGKQHLHVSISYGSRTDQKVIKQIKEMLESMIDDDPTVKTKELGAHN
jgi:hypothetical protein